MEKLDSFSRSGTIRQILPHIPYPEKFKPLLRRVKYYVNNYNVPFCWMRAAACAAAEAAAAAPGSPLSPGIPFDPFSVSCNEL